VNIPNPNSNILLTEDILIPYSCQVFGDEKSSIQIKVLFFVVSSKILIISAIFVIMLVKCCRQKKVLHPMEFYLGLKDGKLL
jgi:hypothetical protein